MYKTKAMITIEAFCDDFGNEVLPYTLGKALFLLRYNFFEIV